MNGRMRLARQVMFGGRLTTYRENQHGPIFPGRAGLPRRHWVQRPAPLCTQYVKKSPATLQVECPVVRNVDVSKPFNDRADCRSERRVGSIVAKCVD